MDLPKKIDSGLWSEGHVQGIAVDEARGFVYFSLTTAFLKTDMQGNPIGSAVRLAGHLGCITLGEDGCVYGSLELKHDAIGKGIIARTGWDPTEEDAFYMVRFDTAKIDRMNMDAENDGIMSTVYLREVIKDYSETDELDGNHRRYGCIGMDGVALGPVFGASKDSPKKLFQCYGILSDTNRTVNDCQVILQYDPSIFEKFGQPLNQAAPHHSGPESYEAKYFLYTGNTTYGIQNFEYDPYTGNYIVAVYHGKKENFSNFPMYIVDGKKAPVYENIPGRGNEKGLILSLADLGKPDKTEGIRGIEFPYGSTGVASMGNGYYYFSRTYEEKTETSHTLGTVATLYKLDETKDELFTEA